MIAPYSLTHSHSLTHLQTPTPTDIPRHRHPYSDSNRDTFNTQPRHVMCAWGVYHAGGESLEEDLAGVGDAHLIRAGEKELHDALCVRVCVCVCGGGGG